MIIFFFHLGLRITSDATWGQRRGGPLCPPSHPFFATSWLMIFFILKKIDENCWSIKLRLRRIKLLTPPLSAHKWLINLMNCTNVYWVHSDNYQYLKAKELFRKLTFFRFCGCDFREENVCSSNFCKFGVTICKSLCDSELAFLMFLGYTKNGEMTLDFYGSVLSSHRFLVVISVF